MWWRDHVAGVDEVGRGPLAGAVYAAAVILHPFVKIPGLNDSKKLTAKKREQLSEVIREQSLSYAIAKADVAEIDKLNILQASFLAMRRAVQALQVPPDLAIIDGNKIPPRLPCKAEYLIKGDAKLDCIKAASIIAKVERDNEMMRLHQRYPMYGLAQHKGYPTPMHLAALREHGPSPVHRMSFAPCREAAS